MSQSKWTNDSWAAYMKQRRTFCGEPITTILIVPYSILETSIVPSVGIKGNVQDIIRFPTVLRHGILKTTRLNLFFGFLGSWTHENHTFKWVFGFFLGFGSPEDKNPNVGFAIFRKTDFALFSLIISIISFKLCSKIKGSPLGAKPVNWRSKPGYFRNRHARLLTGLFKMQSTIWTRQLPSLELRIFVLNPQCGPFCKLQNWPMDFSISWFRSKGGPFDFKA